MKLSVIFTVIALAQLSFCLDEAYFNQYKGHVVYKIIPKDDLQLQLLKGLEKFHSDKVNLIK